MGTRGGKRLQLAAMPPRRRGASLWVAFSGGIDSTVLLHALSTRKLSRLRAVHVHHGLQDAADDWADHCRAVCRILDVPLEVLKVSCMADGSGPEAAAREARYQAMRECMAEGDILATAHHLGDQAETVLMRMARGTGLAGLAAMRPFSPMPPGGLWRPLLGVSREQIETYARSRGLVWVEDPSNRDTYLARNRLRRDILPALRAEWPGLDQNLARAADLAAESAELLAELAQFDLEDHAEPLGPLPITALLALSPARRRNLLRHWVAQFGLPAPYHDTLRRLDTEVLCASPDANPVLAWPGGEFRRYRGRLFAMAPLPPAPGALQLEWDGRGCLELPVGCGRLRAAVEPRRKLHAQVRLVQPGERFQPFGSPHSRTLKNLFQERGVPTWVRERTPVIERNGEAVWIGGIGWRAGRDWTGLRMEVEWVEAPPAARPDF